MSNMRKISDINGYVEGNSKWPDFDKKFVRKETLFLQYPSQRTYMMLQFF